jgi:NAD(P)-dependent dehydrogenase (short-subunit alcohol dehydrogenase family)
MQLKDKVIVVTGALGALGKVVAETSAIAEATVIAVDRVSEVAPSRVAASVAIDLSDPKATLDGFAAIAASHGRIDGLVNVAGGFRWETVSQGSIATWDFLYTLNVRTAVNACRAALPFFPASGGRIVNIGAAGAIKPAAGMGAYAASKAGVGSLTEALAEELKARNITVNAVLPGIIDTPANRADMPDADHSRWVDPHALADVIVFLLSERSAAVTGALIPVTGRI